MGIVARKPTKLTVKGKSCGPTARMFASSSAILLSLIVLHYSYSYFCLNGGEHFQSTKVMDRGKEESCLFLRNVNAAVFMHSFPGKRNGWWAILSDQLQTLVNSPLTACGVPVFLGLPSGFSWPFTVTEHPPFLTLLEPTRRNDVRRYEEAHTLSALYEYCVEHTEAIVAYTHDKGTRVERREINTIQWDWRKLHEYFLFEVPQGCVKSLASGVADLCGTNWRSPSRTGIRKSTVR